MQRCRRQLPTSSLQSLLHAGSPWATLTSTPEMEARASFDDEETVRPTAIDLAQSSALAKERGHRVQRRHAKVAGRAVRLEEARLDVLFKELIEARALLFKEQRLSPQTAICVGLLSRCHCRRCR